MVLTTEFEFASMTDTSSVPSFATKAKAPFGVTATSTGLFPTATVATTWRVAVLITETLFEM